MRLSTFKKIFSLLGFYGSFFLAIALFAAPNGIIGCGGGGEENDVELIDEDGDGAGIPQELLDDDDWEYDYDEDYAAGYDCDDTDATRYPGATETAGDGTDQDCDGYDAEASIDCTGSELDCDGDYVVDSCDNDPYDATDATILTGEDGCDVETDSDGNYYAGDGYMDISCNTYESSYGYTVSDEGIYDSEGEYIGPRTLCDNCDTTYNSDQADSDGDGVGDACDSSNCTTDDDQDNVCDTDEDGDGTVDDNCVCPDGTEDCSTYYNPNDTDSDEDGTVDSQADSDSDGSGDVCDSFTDADGDGYSTEGDENGENADCDDDDATVYPGSTEAEDLIGDGVDQDCDGTDVPDGSEILYVYTGFAGEQFDEDDNPYDGTTPDKPLHSINEALNHVEGSIKYIFVFAGASGNNDDGGLEINEEVTLIGGFKCYKTDEDGEEVELNIYSDDDRAECADASQVKRNIEEDPTEFDVNNLTQLLNDSDEGHTLTISDPATLEGFYIEASDDSTDETSDISTSKVAVHIDNAAATIKNSFIYAPPKEASATGDYLNTIAIYIDNSSETDPVTLTANYIVAGDIETDDVENDDNVYGVYVSGASLVANRNRVVVLENEAGNGYSNGFAYGFHVETEEETKFYNNIIEAQYGLYFSNTDGAEIINNTFYVYTESSGSALYFGTSDDAQIINNIFDGDETSSTTRAVYASNGGSKLKAELRNNLFSSSLDSTVAYYSSTGVSDTDSTSDSDLEAKLDSASTVSDNIGDDDLELDSTTYEPNDDSPAVNAGYSNVTSDIGDNDNDGDDREVGTIDIGAQENQNEDDGGSSGETGSGSNSGIITEWWSGGYPFRGP